MSESTPAVADTAQPSQQSSTTNQPTQSNSTAPQNSQTQPQPQQRNVKTDVEQVGEDLPNATPRDVRLIHLIMASMGVHSYQDRVPLQLMDFAYRYTSGVLNDATLYADHSHAASNTQPAGIGASSQPLTTEDVRLAVAARTNYQFKPAAPKELLLELAAERNKRPLPTVSQTYGLRLPPEKYCLTSKEWQFDDEPDQIMHEGEVGVEMGKVSGAGEGEDEGEGDEDEDVEMGGQ